MPDPDRNTHWVNLDKVYKDRGAITPNNPAALANNTEYQKWHLANHATKVGRAIHLMVRARPKAPPGGVKREVTWEVAPIGGDNTDEKYLAKAKRAHLQNDTT